MPLLIVFVICLIVNGYKQYETARYYGSSGYMVTVMGEHDFSYEAYLDFKGKISEKTFENILAYEEHIKNVVSSEGYNPDEYNDELYCGSEFGARNCLEIIKDEILYAYLYPNTMLDLIGRANESIEFYKDLSGYEVKKNELIVDLYSGRSIGSYGRYDTYSLFLDYDFSTFIITILLIFVFSGIFTSENATGNDKIIKASGRAGSVFLSKQLVMLAFIILSVLLFTVIDIIGFGRYYGFEFITEPLYAIESYVYTPLNITILGAVILSALFRILFLLFAGEVIMLVSSYTKNMGLSLTLCFGVIGALIFLFMFVPDYASPFSLLSVGNLISELSCVNILGNPVPVYFIAPVITAAITIILYIISRKRFIGKSVQTKRRNAV